MEKKMKNMEIINALNGIAAIQKREKEREEAILRPEVSFLVVKNKKALMAAYEAYDSVRKTLVDGNNEELMGLLNAECSINIDTVSTEKILSCDGILMSELEALDFMISE